MRWPCRRFKKCVGGLHAAPARRLKNRPMTAGRRPSGSEICPEDGPWVPKARRLKKCPGALPKAFGGQAAPKKLPEGSLEIAPARRLKKCPRERCYRLRRPNGLKRVPPWRWVALARRPEESGQERPIGCAGQAARQINLEALPGVRDLAGTELHWAAPRPSSGRRALGMTP